MKKVLLLLSVLCVFLSACVSGRAPAATPASSSAPLSTLSPIPPPTNPPPTEAPTATAKPVEFSSSLGVSPEFAATLKAQGINESLNPDGSIRRVVTGWNIDGRIMEENVKIVATGINYQTDEQGNALKDKDGKFVKQDIHNEGYKNGIVTKIDEQGRVLHWNETNKEWVASLPESTDLSNATLYPTGRRDLVIETALLNPDLNKPFSDEAVKNFAGWALYSGYDDATKSSHVFLLPLNNQSIKIPRGKDGNPTFWKEITGDGIVHVSILTQLLNPADQKNVKGNETMFALASAGEWWTLSGQMDFGKLFKIWYIDKNHPGFQDDFFGTTIPFLEIAQRGDWFANHSWGSFPGRPSLDSLLSQPGNDPRQLNFFDRNTNRMLDSIPNLKNSQINLSGSDYYNSIDIGLQKMLVPLSFGG